MSSQPLSLSRIGPQAGAAPTDHQAPPVLPPLVIPPTQVAPHPGGRASTNRFWATPIHPTRVSVPTIAWQPELGGSRRALFNEPYGNTSFVQAVIQQYRDANPANIRTGLETDMGSTLYRAIESGNRDLVSVLTSSELFHNIPADDKKRCLYKAAKMGDLEIVRDLISRSRSDSVNSVDLGIALSLAAEGGHQDVVTYLFNVDRHRRDDTLGLLEELFTGPESLEALAFSIQFYLRLPNSIGSIL